MLFLFGCGTEHANDIPKGDDKPASAPAGPTGRIRGVVRLQGNVPAPSFEATLQDQGTCGDRVPVSRLAIGNNNGVQHAFVYLDGVQTAENIGPRQSLLVDQKNCQYVPHSLIVPAGSKIEITNSDPILHNVHGHQTTDKGDETLFNVAQPVKGQRTTVNTSEGSSAITSEGGATMRE